MPCRTVNMPGGGTAIVCSRGVRPLKCACGARTNLLCDWPIKGEKSGTCDKAVCKCCRRVVGGLDICQLHEGEP